MFPVLFRVGGLEVRSYTVCMLAAVLVVGWLSYREAWRRHRLDERVLLIGSLGLLASFVGAKLSMLVFLGPAEFWRLLPTIPFHGSALAGGLIAGYVAVVLAERAIARAPVHRRPGGAVPAAGDGVRPAGQPPRG